MKGGLTWNHIDTDSFTQTGAGAFNLAVNPDDFDAVIASVGAEAHKKIKRNKGSIIPSAYAGISYDLAGEESRTTAVFSGNSLAVKGIENEQFAGNVGFGLTYEVDTWSVGINYDGKFKSSQDSHAATLQARYTF
uniref:Autotransporter beta-domain-containing protein n=1 Tax=Candidatus Kentrum sp. TC TaxID=2126339 RepID=A0A450YVV3_9GAMM|nr:MAG: Autotransporter beta-domain-containing protein [Candidatus Kentron sp. TC]